MCLWASPTPLGLSFLLCEGDRSTCLTRLLRLKRYKHIYKHIFTYVKHIFNVCSLKEMFPMQTCALLQKSWWEGHGGEACCYHQRFTALRALGPAFLPFTLCLQGNKPVGINTPPGSSPKFLSFLSGKFRAMWFSISCPKEVSSIGEEEPQMGGLDTDSRPRPSTCQRSFEISSFLYVSGTR